MKRWTLLAIAAGVILLAGVPFVHLPGTSRGVRVLEHATSPPSPRSFDPQQSAALFIGVSRFTRDETIVDVPYAADDAVDLAYAFSREPRVALVSPSRVVIALSGHPWKEESKKHLKELKDAGATIEKGEQGDILALLQKQAALAGRNGLLIVSIATHGFVDKSGVPYILGSNSKFRYPETSLPTTRLFEIAAKTEAGRSLFFIDACRERVAGGARGGASPATAAPLINRMGNVSGQVVFFAAASGGYAYDDDDGNGVFTKEVLEGLRCKAGFVRGLVTVETLHTFVEHNVRAWIRQHRDAAIGPATQVNMDGDTKNMPLSNCGGAAGPSPPGDVVHATHDGSSVSAFAANGSHLWSRDMGGLVSRVEVADLDADGSHEVVIGLKTSIKVFDRAGANIWSAGGNGKPRKFIIGHLLPHGPALQITALWNDESRSEISTYDARGHCLSTYRHAGRLQDIAIDRQTSHHNQRIIAMGVDNDAGASIGIDKPLGSVLLLDKHSKLLWKGLLLPPGERVTKLAVIDRDKYSRDIILTTTGGEIHLDFDGNVLASSSQRVTLRVFPHRKRRAHARTLHVAR